MNPLAILQLWTGIYSAWGRMMADSLVATDMWFMQLHKTLAEGHGRRAQAAVGLMIAQERADSLTEPVTFH